MARHKILIGLNYPPGKRAEAGDIVDDLPPKSLRSLLEPTWPYPDGTVGPAIELVRGRKKDEDD